MSPHGLRRLWSILLFALVSGAGLAADILIFLVLVESGVSVLAANAVSATCAVTWVYFASVKRIFSYRGTFLLGLFFAYLIYQAAAVAAASGLVGLLAASFMPPLAAKLAIVPVTFGANYLFMAWLTRRGRAPEN